ncbi:MAG: hypothetical protein HY650_14170 [Acidobacteria bacterium]|nr:hypothetical protein [Acidobacteriota bacterium]
MIATAAAAAEADRVEVLSPRRGQAVEDDEARGRRLLQQAVEALGGQAYLGVKSVVGTGIYSPFDPKGERGQVLPFIDYILYPGSERTEFGKGKKRTIRTNAGGAGWFFDAEQKQLRDQTPEEIESFRRGLMHNIDTILRTWDRPGVRIRALPEKQLWFRQRGLGAELTMPGPGGSPEVVSVYLDPDNKRPVKVAYGDEEDRFFLYQSFNGIFVPLTIDHYKADEQVARIRYDGVDFNRALDPRLFEKPAGADKVK